VVGKTTLENLVREHPEVQIENSFKYEIFKRSSIEEPHWDGRPVRNGEYTSRTLVAECAY